MCKYCMPLHHQSLGHGTHQQTMATNSPSMNCPMVYLPMEHTIIGVDSLQTLGTALE